MATAKKSKDETNTAEVLKKISEMSAHVRPLMQRMHEIITEAAPELKPRVWYGMPGYAKSSSSPVLVFFRHDDYGTFGLTEKASLKPTGGPDGLLIPGSWYFEDLDAATEQRIAEIVRGAIE